MTSLLKRAPECGAETLSRVSEGEKAGMCLPSDASDGAVGPGFVVHGSTVC